MSTLTNNDLFIWIYAATACFNEKREYLTDLDSAIGDADHGSNMHRGFGKVVEEIAKKQPTTPTDTLKLVAMTLIKHVGGASGPLYGTLFLKMSQSLNGVEKINAKQLYEAFSAGYQGLLDRGKAQEGDKTMLDVWAPALNTMKSCLINSNTNIANIMEIVVSQAEKSMKETIPMQAKKGRASYLGERSIGHQDPGATSSFYLLKEAAKSWS